MSKPQIKFVRQRSPSALSLALSLSMGLALVSVALPSLAQSVRSLSNEQLVRTRSNVTLRASPDSVGRIVITLPPQTTLEALSGQFGPWLQVRTAQGVVGWLQSLDVNATTRPTAGFIRPAPDPISPAPIKGTVRSDRALDTVRAVYAAENNPSKGTSAASISPDLSPMTAKASEGMAAVMTVTAPRPADDPISRASRRLLEAETYRTSSEDARKFAFNAGVERVKLISALSMFNANAPDAGPINTTDATTNSQVLALLTDTTLSNNISMQVYVNLLGRWLSLESTQPDLLWTFAVIDSDESKAYGLPGGSGGYVLVTQGLLNTLSTEAELASVLAHEIAHVTLGHPTQARRTDDELAADRSAVVLLARSGFNPNAVLSTIKMANARAQGKTLWTSLIGPDTLTQQRLAGLKVFMGTRFDEVSSQFNQPSIRIAQRLSEINTPDNLAESMPSALAQALQPVLQPLRSGTGKPLLDAQVKGAVRPLR